MLKSSSETNTVVLSSLIFLQLFIRVCRGAKTSSLPAILRHVHREGLFRSSGQQRSRASQSVAIENTVCVERGKH